MDFLLLGSIILGIILLLLAFIGCIIPILPGPPLGFLALLLVKIVSPSTFSFNFILIMGVITAVVFVLDYILPVFGAKFYNASKMGIWFSIFGMIIGIFIFQPFGIILGLLLGVIIGELISGKAKAEALKIGFISLLFSLFAILIKISLVAVMSFYFTKAIIQYFI